MKIPKYKCFSISKVIRASNAGFTKKIDTTLDGSHGRP